MKEKSYFIVASLIFAFAGLLHFYRVIQSWDLVLGSILIPSWVSIFLAVLAGFMIWKGIELAKK